MAVKVKERNGKWWLFIDYKGKRKAKKVGSKKAALEAAAKIEAKITLGQFEIKEEKKRRPFNTYFPNWLDTYIKVDCKPSTYAIYERVYRQYLLPVFQTRDIATITRDEIRQFAYGLLGKGRNRSTVGVVLAPLQGMFSAALEDGHVTNNPCMRILRKVKHVKGKPIDPLNRVEANTLLKTCRELFPRSYPFVLLLLRTGLRKGEAQALQWQDIDFANRCLIVRRSLTNRRLSTPKNGKERRVDMSTQLERTLKIALVERKKETLQKGWREMPLWVFINECGTPINEGHFHRRVWVKLLAKAGLRSIRVHDLRHTFASLLIEQGEPLPYVRDQLGHHSIQITVDIYGHLVPGGNRQAVDRLDDQTDQVLVTTIRNPAATSGSDAPLSVMLTS